MEFVTLNLTFGGNPCVECWKQRSKCTPKCFEVARLVSKSNIIFHCLNVGRLIIAFTLIALPNPKLNAIGLL